LADEWWLLMIEVVLANKTYGHSQDPVYALRDFSFRAERGEFLALMGASGSGKSTLLSAMAGLIPLDSGEVILDEKPFDLADPDFMSEVRLHDVGIVYQDHNLLENLTVEENIALPLELQGWSVQESAEEVSRCLDLVGLSDYQKRLPRELSGGQRQRVGIARAIAGNKKVFLTDEPTGALDTENTLSVAEMFRDLSRTGITVITATHDPRVADRADRVINISDGMLVGTH
jgi:putative ABC transport system ATP-binding protein